MRLSRATAAIALAGIALPAVGAALLSWSVSDRTKALTEVPVAIVNDDVIVTGDTPMAAGRALSDALIHPDDDADSTLGWTLTSDSLASEGLEDGTYAAVLTIPEDFSASVLSLATDDPQQAELVLQTDPAASASTAALSEVVATTAADTLGTEVSTQVLTSTYEGLGTLQSSLADAADGAGEVDDGADQLSDAASQLSDGTSDLADGLGELADGASSLATGAAGIADGTAQAETGVDSLADGAGALADGTSEAADGAAQVAAGVHASAEGADTLSDALAGLADTCLAAGGAAQYCAQVAGAASASDDLASGLDQASQGATATASAMSSIAASSGALADGADAAASGLAELAAGAAQASAGAGSLAEGAASAAEGADSLSDGSAQLADGALSLAEGTEALAAGLDDAAGQVPAYTDDEASSMASVVAEPVGLASQAISSATGWAAAAILAAVLWLGPLAAWATGRRSSPAAILAAPASASRVRRSLTRPALLLGAMQAVVAVSVLWLTGTSLSHPVALAAMSVLAACSFGLLAVGLRAALGRHALTAYATLALVQIATLAGALPVETAPAPLGSLAALLPATAFLDAASSLAGDPTGTPIAAAIVCLILWGALGSVLLRRRVATVRLPRPRSRSLSLATAGADGRMAT